MNPEFWKGKRTFITGHTGFKGSWLSLLLQGTGADLTGYSLEPLTDHNLFDIAGVASGMNSIVGNVCDLENLTSAIKEHQPEIVIHMAAQSLVLDSYSQPVETYAPMLWERSTFLKPFAIARLLKLFSSLPAINVMKIRNGTGATAKMNRSGAWTLIPVAKDALNW